MLDLLGRRRAVGGPGHRLLRRRGGRCLHRGRRLHSKLRGGHRPRRGRRGGLGLRLRGGRWRRWRGLRGRRGWGHRCGCRSGFRGRLRRRRRRRRRGRFRRARRGRRRRWAVVAAVAAVAVVAAGAVSVPVAVPVAVMSATPAARGGPASGDRDQSDGGRAVPGVDRRVGAAISHGRRGGQRRPQQHRDHQQASGTGSVHPGSMGSRAPAHAELGCGSPERMERRP